jgi:uncharacterized protein (DUF1684 family)
MNDNLADLDLADWRERTARLYLSDVDLDGFRAGRDAMFAGHRQSPIPAAARTGFSGLRYFPADTEAVTIADLRRPDGDPSSGDPKSGDPSSGDPSSGEPSASDPKSGELRIDTGGPDGIVRYRRVAVALTPWGPLTLWWIEAYGGGLFLPFRDGTCRSESYGGGRYLTDTVKGTFGRGLTVLDGGRVRLDFNYAYNPSCAYDDRWACPLAPRENWLEPAIRAGERRYEAHS